MWTCEREQGEILKSSSQGMEAQTYPSQCLLWGTWWGRHRQETKKPQVPRTEGTPMCCHNLSQGWETCLFLHRKAWEKWLRTGPWQLKRRNRPQRRNLTQKINSQNIVNIKGLLWALNFLNCIKCSIQWHIFHIFLEFSRCLIFIYWAWGEF